METLFKKSLTELVRGIRANKKNEQQYISKCLQEIKEELRLVNKKAKMIAVQKLTYLHMLGYDVSWAAFNIIEVMSQPLFTSKRIGYLAASQVFSKDTDVVMLTTNLFRKDLQSVNQYETGLAINCLSNICNTDLSRDLAPDLVTLLTSSRPYIRKKAVLALYKIFLQFPQALRPAYPRLKEKLEDADMTVVCAAVNVICELARKNPKNYLGLAPILFKILTMSTNNWMLIKIIKLFGSLTPIEPRLARKLVEPLNNIMNTTSAMSLLYECIQTCTIGLTENANIIRLCITKLRLFIENPDQNLKYLGLLALSRLMPVAPKAIQEHRDMVINCLDDEDVTIRLRALDLIVGMVNKRNLMDIIKKLMDKLHDAEGGYQDDLISKIIDICSQNSYAHISDFEWYITVLVELTHVQGTVHGKRISDQLMDVCIRVQIIREFSVKNMVTLLQDTRFTGENPTEHGICEVLYSAAWIVGEFALFTPGEYVSLIEILLHPRVTNLPGHIQSIYIHNALKLFTKIASNTSVISKPDGGMFGAEPSKDPVSSAINTLKTRLPTFTKSPHLETQERACFTLEVIKLVDTAGMSVVNEIAPLFNEALNPVSAKAWKKVPLPQGLDLNQQINTPPPSDDEESSDEDYGSNTFEVPQKKVDTEDERKRRAQARIHDPFYLGNKNNYDDDDAPEIEVLTDANLNVSNKNVLFPSLSSSSGSKKHRKKIHILKTEELPEGATADSSDDDNDKGDDPFAGIDLTTSLKPEEELKVTSYPLPGTGLSAEPKRPSKEERRRKRREGDKGERRDRKERKGEDERRNRRDKESERSSKGERDRRDRKNKHKEAERKSTDKSKSADLLQLGTPDNSTPERRKPANNNNNNNQAQPAPPSNPTPNIQLAGQNNTIKVGYEFGINPAQPDKVMAIFHLKSGAEQLSDFEFKIVETLNTKLTSFSDPKVNLLIPPSSVNSHRLLFQFKSFLQPQKLSGTLVYKANGTSVSLPLNITIPCSSFVQPTEITEEQFSKLMEKDGSSLSSSSGQIQVKDARVALERITDIIHVKVISLTSAALLYGKSTQGHNVFVLIKNRNNSLNIDIKTPSSTFSSALLQELQAALA